MKSTLHDTHFHLDLFENPARMVERINAASIYTIAVTNLPAVFENTTRLIGCTKYIRAALGFHPELANRHAHQLDKFLQLLPLTKYVGEIGLDNFKKTPADYAVQKRVFETIISACHEATSKILTIHSRRAEKDVISIIGSRFPGKVILHWYSGSIAELERALSYGFYFSINHAMTQSENGRKIITHIPKERMLLETDGPFVKWGNKPFDPSLVGNTVMALTELTKNPEMNSICSSNFEHLLNSVKPSK
ncbi:MAG: Qat anti-phage system TatD family nuclease QatD [Flavisolibacter sp.]